MDIIAQVTPNNEIRIGLQSIASPAKKRGDSTSVRARELLDRHYAAAQIEIARGFSMDAVLNHPGLKSVKLITKAESKELQEAKTRSLDFIREFQHIMNRSKKKKKSAIGYGELGRGTKFGAFARRKMLAAGSIVARKYSTPELSTFVTLTIPGSDGRARELVPRYTGYIINRLMQIIRRRNRLHPCNKIDWLFSWEYQKRGWLHLHMCLSSGVPGESFELGEAIRDKWFEVLQELSVKTGKDQFSNPKLGKRWEKEYWQSDVSPVKKSVANYLSKYIGKGNDSKNSDSRRSKIYLFPIARWWGMARNLSQEVKEQSSSLKVSGLLEDDAIAVVSGLYKMLNLQASQSPYQYSFDIKYGERQVGWGSRSIFYFPSSEFDAIRNALGNVIAALLGGVEYGSIDGSNWLLAAFGRKNVPLAPPSFTCYSIL